MTLTEEVAALKKHPFFEKIDSSRLKLLAFASERQSFLTDQFLVREGEIGACAYLILHGRAEVLFQTEHGFFKVGEVGKNDVVGEISILCDVPRLASIRALTEIDALKISKDVFLSMAHEFPDMALEIIRVLGSRLDHSSRMIKRLSDSQKSQD